ncbi:peptidase S74 [Bacillus cereus]|nr:peptidase S74 [Bacillus cereus]
MRTPSGDLHIVDFKTSQIVSAIQPKDYWDDKRRWEIKNNIDKLEFRVFENTDHAATLVQQNLVLKEVRGGRIVPYVITEAEKDSDDRSLMVYASGEWIQLAKAGIIEPQKIESKTLKQCMEIALKGTKWEIGKTEHDGAHSMVIEEFTDPLNLLKKISVSFELEIQYRAEVVGSQIVARYVDMVKKRGRDTRKEVTFGKDLIGIKRIENSQNICTAVLGYVQKENGEFITISEINNGVPYLVDDAAFQRWNEKGKHKFAFYTPQTEDQDMSPQRLMTLMKTEMNKLVNTSVSYEVQAQSIGQVFGLAHELINEGDTIRIIDAGFTPKLYLEARAIAGDESFKDPTQDKYVFGDYREIVDQNDELRRLYQKILSSLYDKIPADLFKELENKVNEQDKAIEEAQNDLKQALEESKIAKDLSEEIQDYIENNMVDIIEQPTPPTAGLIDGKTLWLDSSDPENKVLKLWKDGKWQRVIPDTSRLQTAIDQVKKDYESMQNEMSDIITDVENKVDKTWIDKQLEDKANKEGVYTKDYIDKNLVGKQVYETDKEGNIKKFTEMQTSINENAEEIGSKAEKSTVQTLENGLKQVNTSINEVKQTAESNTSKITSFEGTVNQTNNKLTDLTKKTNEITQTVDSNKKEISSLNQKAGDLETKTNTIVQTVDTNTATIKSLKTEVNDLNKGIVTVNEKTNEIKQTLEKNQQTITSLSENQGQQGTIIQQNTSDITQLNNQIKSKVSDTQMQEYVGGLGSTNILFNTAFEDRVINPTSGIVTSRTPSLSKWIIQGAGTNKTVTVDSARNHDGYNSVKISSAGFDTSQFVGFSQRLPAARNSGEYVYSAWFYVADKSLLQGQGVVIKLQFYNGSSGLESKQIEIEPTLVNGSWVKAFVTVSAPDVAVTEIRADIWVRRNGVVWVSQPQLQKGAIPSTFMENPKDYANYDQLVGEIAKKVATSDFNNKVTQMETSITQQADRIDLKAESKDVYTKTEANGQFGSKAMVESHNSSISLMADAINQRVEKGDIASTINQTAQAVLIQANKIYLDGYIEAKHLKAQTLQGVTIQTAPQGSGSNQIRLNAQNMTLHGSGRNRGYFGFMDNTQSLIKTAIVLGNDYTSNTQIEGSMVLEQTTPTNNNYTVSTGSIGIADSRAANGDIIKTSYIDFARRGDMSIFSTYGMTLSTSGSGMNLRTEGSGNQIHVNSAGPTYFTALSGSFTFRTKRDVPAEKWSVQIKDESFDSGDVDINLGNVITLRAARMYPYSQEGLQVKNNKGNDWATVSCGVLNYSSLSQRSTRQLKTAIKDIEAINPLEKLMELTPRQYYMKEDINRLYEKRQKIIDSGSSERIPTYEDIPHQYGFIAEEVPEEFSTPYRKAVNMYPLITMGIAGTQEVYKKHLALEETVKTQAEQLEVQAVAIQKQEERIARLEELLFQ